MSDGDDERQLRLELMRMDLNLIKQAFWETPRNIDILRATAATLVGLFGYKIGSNAKHPVVVQMAALPVPASH